VRSWLEESGVDVEAVTAARTATASAHLNAEGAATYVFDLEWSLEGATGTGAGIVHTGSIAALIEPGATDVKRMIAQMRDTALVTYDPNIRPALMGEASRARRQVEEFVGLSDLVKASDEDLRWLYPAEDPSTVALRWLEAGPAVVVVTTGEGGSFAVARSGVVAVQAQRVDVIDTVGAGDTFMGALIDSVISGGYRDARARVGLRGITSEEVEAMLRFASTAAAVTVARPGADPPRREELPVDLLSSRMAPVAPGSDPAP
jgi:fructokinase